MAINLNISDLTAKQLEVLNDNSRFKVLVTGRRGGKTAVHQATLYKQFFGNSKYSIFVAPSRQQTKRIIWNRFKSKLPENLIKETNKTELSYKSITNSIMQLESYEAGERIRGIEKLHHISLDEFADMDMNFLEEVLIPSIADTKGTLLVTGTPKGKGNCLYELTQRSDFKYYHWTTEQGGLVAKDEIERARLNLDPRTFRQEYEASFEDYHGIIFYTFSDKNYTDKVYDPSKYTYLSFDFNVNPMTCLVFQKYDKAFYCVKEFVIPNSDTPETALKVRDFVQTDKLDITGDASGQSRGTKASLTDYQIIKKVFTKGFVKLPRKNPLKVDRFNVANSSLRPINGDIKLYINPKECPTTVANLRRVTMDDYDRKDPNNLTHTTDAFTYLAYNYLKI